MEILEAHFGSASFYTGMELTNFINKEKILQKDIYIIKEFDYPTEYGNSIFFIGFRYFKPACINL